MDALPPDPYAALGVARDATAATIKTQYRKLVLRLHPDKVQDESQKQNAADQFHKVQTAWEIVGDDTRRQRYDAQCRLAELRKDIERESAEVRGHNDVRTAGFRVPTDSPRGGHFFARGPERSGRMSPQYEERRPAYADHFDSPRPTSRKDESYDRPAKRASPRDDHKKSKTSSRKTKDSERSSREEKVKRAEQDVRRERDSKKFAYVSVEEDPSSDSDAFERRQRRMREEDEERRRARAAMEEVRRKKEEEAAAASFFGTERARKLWDNDYKTKESMAREYMARSTPQFERRPSASMGVSPQERESFERRPSAPLGTSPQDRETFERRPSAPISSSREKVETIKREGRPSIEVRRGSGRPTPVSRDSGRKRSSREKEINIVDEPEEPPRRAPPLNKTMSSPENIRPSMERRRSNSMQDDRRDAPQPSFKRSETMPSPLPKGESRRKEPSARNSYPTPEATPEPTPIRTFSHGPMYVDEMATSPDGDQTAYTTVYHEPGTTQRLSSSPSPIRNSREKSRGSTPKRSTPKPPSNKRTTSRTFVFPDGAEAIESFTRPSLSRENSGRLFGEIPTTSSPRPKIQPSGEIRFSNKHRPEDVKTQTGYNVKKSPERLARPSYNTRTTAVR